MKKILLLLIILSFSQTKAQCPVITCPSSCTITCNAPATVTATCNYSANITSRWLAPGNIPILSSGTSTSVVRINAINSMLPSTYTVEFKDNSSGCTSTKTLNAVSQSTAPIFHIEATNYTQTCQNSAITLSIGFAGTTPTPGGPVWYAVNSVTASPVFSLAYSFTISGCGSYYVACKDPDSVCLPASYTVTIGCSSFSIPAVSMNAFDTICNGSSTSIYAYGAPSYSWNTGQTTASISVSPTLNTTYTVTGINGPCSSTQSMAITVLPSPNVSANSKTICAGDAVKLFANGAGSYTWANQANTVSLLVSPSVTTVFTVTGSNSIGCKGISTPTVTVNECAGLESVHFNRPVFDVYPNPAKSLFILHSSGNSPSHYLIFDLMGKEICKGNFTGSLSMDLQHFNAGAYFIRFNSDEQWTYKKFIVEK